MEYPITLFKHGESKEIKNAGEEARAREQGFTEPYKYQEYPKALYRNGERVHVSADSVERLHDGGCRVVKSKDEEDAARAEGYRMLHEPAPEPERRTMPKARRTTLVAKTAPRARPRVRTASNALCRAQTT
jgi:hypothetical protein